MSTPIRPWYFRLGGDPHNQGLIIEEQTGRTVAVSYDNKDAPLLAAAPEMLATLQACLEAMGDYYDAKDAAGDEGARLHDLITATIYKATHI